jgi:SAM-dependent methyltransferase
LVRKNTESHWSSYTQSAVHYSTEDLNWKTSFVSDCISEFRPKRILDIGSNTGFFSRLAAKNGATVVAWDADTSAVEHGWREAHTVQASVTSLVADFARPTPSAGWNNAETSSLLDRARGQFDLVIMLAVMHHLLASDQIPLEQIARLTRELTTKWLLIEWVNPDDGKFRELSHGRDSLYRDLSEERFLSAFSTHFKPVRRDVLHNRRVLFVMETK